MGYSFTAASSHKINFGDIGDSFSTQYHSVSFFTKLSSWGQNGGWISKRTSAGSDDSYAVFMDGGVLFYQRPSGPYYAWSTSGFPTNEWVSVVIITNSAGAPGEQCSLYINGELVSISAVHNNGGGQFVANTSSTFQLGSANAATYFFTGGLAEVAMWSSVLTQGDAESLAAGTIPSQIGTESLVFYASLEEDSVDIVTSTEGEVTGATLTDHPTMIPLTLPPEMLIEYNATPIENGDSTPSGPDGTFFGSADIITGTIEQIFSITNSGEDNLTLDADPYVALSGTNTDQFSIIEQPASGTLPEGYTFDFTIEFDPTTTGEKNAWVVIYNNSDVDPFTFAIQGSGISAPTISLTPSTLSATGVFGQSVANKTFDINNTGSASLEYEITSNKTWVSFDDDAATLASGASETVTVSIDPNGLAFNTTHVATITVADDNASNSPQTIELSLTINHGESFLYTNPQNVNRIRTSSALLLQNRTDSGVQKINYSRQFTGDTEVTTDGGFITFNPLNGPQTNDYNH